VRRTIESGREKKSGGLIASIGIHIVLVLLLAQMVFQYPIGMLIGYSAARHITPETVHYIRVAPPPAPASAKRPAQTKPATKGGAPAPLIAPSSIPTVVNPPMSEIQAPQRAAGGTGNGLGVTGGAGVATGIVPAMPDSRIVVSPQAYFAMPTKTREEKLDSIIASSLGVYIDSLEILSHQRQPGDWTYTSKDGKKYGWDPVGIRIGKFTIPNALLALLPLNIGAQANPSLHTRLDAFQDADVQFQGRLQVTEDQFKAAVQRIRERNEKLHEERSKSRPDSTSH
jgi:hypothetical protein